MKNSLILALVSILVYNNPCNAKSLAIHADIVSGKGAQKSWIVIDQSTGKITSVAKTDKKVPPDAIKFEYNGYAFPGLIDTHNHLVWNSIKTWIPDKVYNNRFEWKDQPVGTSYGDSVMVPYNEMKKEPPENRIRNFTNSSKYGEIRAIIGGTTMIESSYGTPPPPTILVRNLTRDPYSVVNETDIAKIKPPDLEQYKKDLSNGKLKRLFVHIAEGKRKDAASLAEYADLKAKGLMLPNVAIIHGSAFEKTQFTELAKKKMGMSWSPRSNIALYNETTAIPDAIAAGVTIALSPDWTISGSNNLLEELKFADDYSRKTWGEQNPVTPKRLYSMVTTDAAKVAGIDKEFGKLQKNFTGDLFLAEKRDDDPFKSLLKTTPKDISLVVVGGMPVYGNDKEMKEFDTAKLSEQLEVDGATKRIIVRDGTEANKDGVKEITKQLSDVIGDKLSPLVEKH